MLQEGFITFFEIIKAILMGIVEGITEWLPISSTGHMILVEQVVKFNASEEFMSMFRVVIQLGAILAVVVLFWNKLWPFGLRQGKVISKPSVWNLWFKVVAATLPVLVISPLDDWMEEHFYNAVVVALALIVYGVAFIVIERWRAHRLAVRVAAEGRQPGSRPAGAHFAQPAEAAEPTDGGDFGSITRLEDLPWSTALGIGCFQVLSLIPGTSRSGSTIIGGLLLGTTRSVAAEFTFFLAIPVMFGASALKLVKYVFLDGGTFGVNEISIMVVGCVVAFVVSMLAIKWLMGFVRRHTFTVFGIYRIVLGVLVLAYFFVIKPAFGLA